MLTWDENKRQFNIANHGVDFIGCDAIFDGPVLSEEDADQAYGEHRINLLGLLQGRVRHLTYTDDGVVMRVISLRNAEKPEVRRYVKAIFQH
ncbi:MAG: BrnT family toxin [Pseudomonadales bacterium]|nr:BrnT family toxin [Pseudomonadales bacterium]